MIFVSDDERWFDTEWRVILVRHDGVFAIGESSFYRISDEDSVGGWYLMPPEGNEWWRPL